MAAIQLDNIHNLLILISQSTRLFAAKINFSLFQQLKKNSGPTWTFWFKIKKTSFQRGPPFLTIKIFLEDWMLKKEQVFVWCCVEDNAMGKQNTKSIELLTYGLV